MVVSFLFILGGLSFTFSTSFKCLWYWRQTTPNEFKSKIYLRFCSSTWCVCLLINFSKALIFSCNLQILNKHWNSIRSTMCIRRWREGGKPKFYKLNPALNPASANPVFDSFFNFLIANYQRKLVWKTLFYHNAIYFPKVTTEMREFKDFNRDMWLQYENVCLKSSK